MASSALSQFNRATFDDRVFEARETRLRKALRMLEDEARRGRLLDVAAGGGIAAQALAHRGWAVSALDISEPLTQQLRGRGIEDVRVHDLAAGPLPYSDGTFDAVFAAEIIEHLVDTAGFLADVWRILAPGSTLVLTTPNLASFQNRLRLVAGRYPRWVDYELGGQGHVRAYTLPVLRRQLRAAGFVLEAVRGNWVPVLPQALLDDVKCPALARTGDWFPTLSQGLIVKARKVVSARKGVF